MQTEIGREISETGIVPELPYFGPFWDNDNQPLFEEIDIDPNDLGSFPEGTVLKVDPKINPGYFYANPLYFRKEDKGWMRLPIESEYPYPRMPISIDDTIFEHAAELMIIHVPES